MIGNRRRDAIRRWPAAVLPLACAVVLSLHDVSSAQVGSEGWVTPRTPWGDPDLQGVWPGTSMMGVPIERPKQLGDRLLLSDEEFAAREQQASAQSQAETRGADLEKQTRQLQNELAELRRVSATSIANYEENKQLKTRNQELLTQVTELTSQVGQLERNTQFRWLMGGGALVLIGLALGAWIKSRPKRSSWA